MSVRPELSDEVWQELNSKKRRPTESTEDVIRRLLEKAEQWEDGINE